MAVASFLRSVWQLGVRVKNSFEIAEQLNMIEGRFPPVCSDPCHTFPQIYCALQKETTAKQSKITLTYTEHRKKYT